MNPAFLVIGAAGLLAFAFGAIVYVLVVGRVDHKARDKRFRGLVETPAAKAAVAQANTRRRSVQDVLKDIEMKKAVSAKHANSPPLPLALEQAGLTFGLRGFVMMSGAMALVPMLAAFVAGLPIGGCLVLAFVGGLGVPRLVVRFLRKRRQHLFIERLPDALEALIRGLKAGLTVQDGVRIVANDGPEPVRSEFRRIVEELPSGMALDECMQRMAGRMPVAEANYLAIVVSIQAKTGGNLSEALGNLARVLRERRKIKAKIKALSAEARSSAWIIGLLPFIVTGLIYMVSRDYIMHLFTAPLGHIVLVCSAVWMAIGIFVMKKMVQIDV